MEFPSGLGQGHCCVPAAGKQACSLTYPDANCSMKYVFYWKDAKKIMSWRMDLRQTVGWLFLVKALELLAAGCSRCEEFT